jgi:hypothetical protein
MKLTPLATALVLGVAACASANADTLRFTATSASVGVLGFIEYDSSIFNTASSYQLVLNSELLAIDFTDPISGLHIDTAGDAFEGTFFDGTGALPTVVGGMGFTGGDATSGGVWIYGTNGVLVGTDYANVNWSTTTVSAVPEPENYALLLAGLGVLGFMVRRRSK